MSDASTEQSFIIILDLKVSNMKKENEQQIIFFSKVKDSDCDLDMGTKRY